MKKTILSISCALAIAGFISSCQQEAGDVAGKMKSQVDSTVNSRTKALADTLTMGCNKNVMDSAVKLAEKMEAKKAAGSSAAAPKKVEKPSLSNRSGATNQSQGTLTKRPGATNTNPANQNNTLKKRPGAN
jgi:hypothetical protein